MRPAPDVHGPFCRPSAASGEKRAQSAHGGSRRAPALFPAKLQRRCASRCKRNQHSPRGPYCSTNPCFRPGLTCTMSHPVGI